MGWLTGVFQNICKIEVTLRRSQSNDELKAVFKKSAVRSLLGGNTGWVFGGADTCRLPYSANIQGMTLIPSPQLTMSINC